MFSIRLADERHDNFPLCQLAAHCPQGDGKFQFFYERTDFWERSRSFPKTHVLIAESNGMPVGTATICLKDVWIGGNRQRVAYLFDRMVSPSSRRQGLGRRLLAEQLAIARSADVTLTYSYVLENNLANHGLMESGGLVAHPHRAEFYTLFAREPRANDATATPIAEGCEPSGLPHWESINESFLDVYEFVDPAPASCDQFIRLGDSAVAGVRRHMPKWFVHLPWLYRVAGRWLSAVPRLGKQFCTWSLHLLWEARQSPDAIRALLQAVKGLAASASAQVVNVPLFATDPVIDRVRRASINRYHVAPTPVRLYLCGPATHQLLESAKPLLVSGRDL